MRQTTEAQNRKLEGVSAGVDGLGRGVKKINARVEHNLRRV